MIRTNIHLREDQRDNLATVATVRKTTPAEEVREAIDDHLSKHRAMLKKGRKMPGR